MLKKCLTVAFAGLSLSLAAAGSASADTTGPDLGTATFTTTSGGGGTGLVTFTAPMINGRCALPWFGSVAQGVSTPIGSTNVVCDDLTSPITQSPTGSNALF